MAPGACVIRQPIRNLLRKYLSERPVTNVFDKQKKFDSKRRDVRVSTAVTLLLRKMRFGGERKQPREMGNLSW